LPESLEAQLLLQMRQLRADTRAAETRLKAQEKQIKEDRASLKSVTFLKVSNSFLSKDCGDEDCFGIFVSSHVNGAGCSQRAASCARGTFGLVESHLGFARVQR